MRVCIEDKAGPKTNSLAHEAKQNLCEAEEFAGKIRAFVAARTSPMVLIARVEALIAGAGPEEALRRSYLYQDAGADCLIVHSRSTSPDEVIRFAQTWDGTIPIVLIPTTYALHGIGVSGGGKVQMVIYANQLMRAAVKVQTNLLAKLRRDHDPSIYNDDLGLRPPEKVL